MKERDRALKVVLQSKQLHDKRKYTTLRNKVTKNLRHAKASLFINKIREGKGSYLRPIEEINRKRSK